MAKRKRTRKTRKRASKGNILTKKKKLTQDQEFQIMKLVLDKFLWLGFVIMTFGLYVLLTGNEVFYRGLSFMIVGAIVLVLFMMLIIREYEFLK